LKLFVRVGAQPPAWSSLAREEVRISSRFANERYRPDSGFADGRNIAGGMPPASRNNLVPTACDIPTWTAASSLAIPAAIAAQNRPPDAHLVLPPPGDLVRTMAFDQTDPNAACASSSQVLLQGVATTI
jgi:hypothetical protein